MPPSSAPPKKDVTTITKLSKKELRVLPLDNDGWAYSVSRTPQSVVVRCLRRLVWQALQQDDAGLALELYQSTTRTDWERWMMQQQNTQQQAVHQQHQKHSSHRKGTCRNLSKTTTSLAPTPNTATTTSHQDDTSASSSVVSLLEDERNVPLLARFMSPSEPFTEDDLKDPILDSYDTNWGQQQESHQHLRMKHQQPKRAFAFRRRYRGDNSRSSNSNNFVEEHHHLRGRIGGVFRRRTNGQGDSPPQRQAAQDALAKAYEDGTDVQAPGAAPSVTTTLLHEAARLGNADLVRFLLDHEPHQQRQQASPCPAVADPNVRNSSGQTALHLVAGGFTASEHDHYVFHNKDNGVPETILGIHAISTKQIMERSKTAGAVPVTVQDGASHSLQQRPQTLSVTKRATRSVGRLLHGRKSRKQEEHDVHDVNQWQTPQMSKNQWDALEEDRLEATMAILSWSTTQGGTASSTNNTAPMTMMIGPSTNAVDARGRTALHYAAELGRANVCFALLSSSMEQTMLTIVDDQGQTPAELAGAQGHVKLAAQLEARTLLYRDPYGMDEELLAASVPSSRHENSSSSEEENDDNDDDHDISSVQGVKFPGRRSQRRQKRRIKEPPSSLATPFDSFETWDMARVQKEREDRIKMALGEMQRIAEKRREEKTAGDVLSDKNSSTAGTDSSASTTVVPSSSRNSGEDDVDAAAEITHMLSLDSLLDPEDECDGEAATLSSVPSSSKSSSEEYVDDADEVAAGITHMLSLDSLLDPEDGCDGVAATLSSVTASVTGAGKCTEAESADLHVFKSLNKSHVEMFLSSHAWDVEAALTAFYEDPVKAFAQAGVPLPLSSTRIERKGGNGEASQTCLICCDVFDTRSTKSSEWRDLAGCPHSFCRSCLGDYIADCSKSKVSGICVICPHYECLMPLSPIDIVELSPTGNCLEALIDASNQNFVAKSNAMRFCPHPGCSGVVKLSLPPHAASTGKAQSHVVELVGAVCTAGGGQRTTLAKRSDCPLTYEGIRDPNYHDGRSKKQPMPAHRFCFSCGDAKPHWPITCEKLSEWKTLVDEKISTVNEDGSRMADFNDIAHKLWMKANTRPCPNCKAPIQKNEGCNHMTCSNPRCKHEFCWICRKPWKNHTTETGGFFRCNVWINEKEHDFYDTPPSPEEDDSSFPNDEDLTDTRRMRTTYGTAMHESRVARKRSQELTRFLHHYQRWTAHAESAELEAKMADTVSERLGPVVQAAIDFSCDPSFNISFVHDAFVELRECRSVLQHSYAFSYFRYSSPDVHRRRQSKRLLAEKFAFEHIQAELEVLTEQMSDVVARSHLRASKSQILFLTATAAGKRKEFSIVMTRILVQEGKDAKEASQVAAEKNLDRRHLIRRRQGETGRIIRFPEAFAEMMASGGNEAEEGIDSDDTDMEEALRASLEDFMSNGGARADFNMDDASSNETSAVDELLVVDWDCPACTFMNSPGRRNCEMCGTASPFLFLHS